MRHPRRLPTSLNQHSMNRRRTSRWLPSPARFAMRWMAWHCGRQWLHSFQISLNSSAKPPDRQPVATAMNPSGCDLSYDAGDRLLFVTDGVTDQIGGPQNPRAYGYKRMQEVFSNSVASSAAEVVQALMHSVGEWQGAQVRRDDVTILCVDL
ncbi:MAG: hypothetical protein EBY28_18925 [Betaproteobacteria bacterium]|nr:hypothetical protein [Betaproteobacteria bacterium]